MKSTLILITATVLLIVVFYNFFPNGLGIKPGMTKSQVYSIRPPTSIVNIDGSLCWIYSIENAWHGNMPNNMVKVYFKADTVYKLSN